MELLWRAAVDDDAVIRFVCERVERIALAEGVGRSDHRT